VDNSKPLSGHKIPKKAPPKVVPQKDDTKIILDKTIPKKIYPKLTAIEIKRLAHDYLIHCDKTNKQPNKPGLCLFFGFTSCKQAWDYWDNRRAKGHAACDGWDYALTLVEDVLNSLSLNPLAKNWKGPIEILARTYHYTEKLNINQQTSNIMVYVPQKLPEGAPVDVRQKSSAESNVVNANRTNNKSKG